MEMETKEASTDEDTNLKLMTHGDVANSEENNKSDARFRLPLLILSNLLVISYVSYVTYRYLATRDECVSDCALTLCSPFGMLLLVSGGVYCGLIYFKLLKPRFGKAFHMSVSKPTRFRLRKAFKSRSSRVALLIVFFVLFLAYVIFEIFNDLTRLRALAGVAIFVAVGYFSSANRRKTHWRPVICGAIFQFLLGLLFIRWPVGRSIFACFGAKVAQFLSFGKDGAEFVFGKFLVHEKAVFAFGVLPVVYFFSLFISVGYYLGAMQWILFKLGWILQSILGTTVCESVNAASSILLSMSEGSLIIRPYIKDLTQSEIHAVMVSGFATVSGSVMVAYISFGADPAHLITASVMAAPASLFFAKLFYPELEESKTSSNNIQMEKSTDSSLLDAATNGASQATSLILNSIANLVAFVAVVTLADALLIWATSLAGFEGVNIQFLLGKLFMPVSWLIGIDWVDCEKVGFIIGTKTIVNEFVAFKMLGEYKTAGLISERSAAIATFAVCSFANPASIGIMIGVLSGLAPERRASITKVAMRSFCAASLVTLCTASIAGLLLTEQ